MPASTARRSARSRYDAPSSKSCVQRACVGIGLASMRMLQASTRQPESMPELQTTFLPAVGVIDGAFVVATGIGLWFAPADPFH